LNFKKYPRLLANIIIFFLNFFSFKNRKNILQDGTLANIPDIDSPSWTKYIEVYKRDEGKRRQISGPRNYVSDAKMYRYTQGTRNRSRGYNNNYRGSNRDNYGYQNNNNQNYRDMVSRGELNDKVQNAAKMERFIANAGEHARDRRSYDRDNDTDNQSEASYAHTDNDGDKSQMDSLELDFAEAVETAIEGEIEKPAEITEEK
jgi:hypothetical protein